MRPLLRARPRAEHTAPLGTHLIPVETQSRRLPWFPFHRWERQGPERSWRGPRRSADPTPVVRALPPASCSVRGLRSHLPAQGAAHAGRAHPVTGSRGEPPRARPGGGASGGTVWQRRRPSFPPERPMHPLPAAFALLAATQMGPLCHLPSGTEDAGRTRATPVFLSPHLLNINNHTTPILRHLNFPRYFPQFSRPSGSVSLAVRTALQGG